MPDASGHDSRTRAVGRAQYGLGDQSSYTVLRLFPVLGAKWARRWNSASGWWDLTASYLETAAQAASLEFL